MSFNSYNVYTAEIFQGSYNFRKMKRLLGYCPSVYVKSFKKDNDMGEFELVFNGSPLISTPGQEESTKTLGRRPRRRGDGGCSALFKVPATYQGCLPKQQVAKYRTKDLADTSNLQK